MISLNLESPNLKTLIELALNEDGVKNDLTTLATGVDASTSKERYIRATLIAKKKIVAAGGPIAAKVIELAGAKERMKCSLLVDDGAELQEKQPWLFLEGNPYDLLRLERVILNFLMRASGIATQARHITGLLEGTSTKLLHTRKTVPGHRETDIYASLVGGAHAHRRALDDAILVKENHWRTAETFQNLKEGIARLRSQAKFVEIEVTNFIELKHAMEIKPDRILLDNFTVSDAAKAAALFGSAVELEASGNITAETARAYADTGVDYISSGAITHSPAAADISLLFDHRK